MGGEKLAAARRLAPPTLESPTHEKVVMRWAPNAPFVMSILDKPDAPMQIVSTDRRFHFLNLHKLGRKFQLLCHIWADAEWKEFAELTDEEVVLQVIDGLRSIFPTAPGGEPTDDMPFVQKPA